MNKLPPCDHDECPPTHCKMTTIDQLKTELREFIKLSETITPGEWCIKQHQREIGNSGEYETESWIAPDDATKCVTNGWNLEDEDESNFNFIARSRNISPTMAKGWLEVIETLNDMPFNVADALELKLIKLWEETK